MSDDRRGFSGLNALVSDVSDLPPVPAAPPRPATPAGDEGSAWVCPPPPRKKWPVQQVLAFLVIGGVAVLSFIKWNNTPPDPPIVEEKPPIGTTYTLTRSQLKYCLSQEVRLKGARDAAVETSKSDIRRLNEMIKDFNARCANATYRVKGSAPIQRDVEANRHKLEREGVMLLRFPSSP